MRTTFARFATTLFTLTLLAASSFATARADESDVAEGIARAIIRQASVKCLADREFEFEEATFKGTAKAVEPEKHVEVEIVDFLYVPSRVVVRYDLTARFEFAGSVKVEKTEHKVRATANVSAQLDLSANYREEGGGFVIDAKIDDLDDFVVKVDGLEPDDLPGGKAALEKAAAESLAEHSEILIRDINAWLQKNNRY